MSRLSFALALVAAFGISWADDGSPIPRTLTDETFETWRDFIHPKGDELAWERVEWHMTLWAGLAAAQEQKKPFAVWIMNGHPCGTT